MRIAILHNQDHTLLEEDPGREAREDVVRVAAAIASALSTSKHQVSLVPVEGSLKGFHEALATRPELVVNLCESLAADARGEALVPAMLDLLGVPYTGNTSLTLALALHKNKAKEILRARGVPTPDFCLVEHLEDVAAVDLPFPLIVKPSREDASVGIDFDSVVKNRQALGRAVSQVLRTFQQPALIEQFIAGREVYVPVLGNAARRALPLSEIHFGAAFDGRPNIVSYKAKWHTDAPEYLHSPSGLAQLDAEVEARCVAVALQAFEALECRDYGRVDLRVDAHGRPYVIDINPNCDLHPQAGFAKAATAAGLSYADLALHLVDLASERRHGDKSPRPTGQRAPQGAAEPHRDLHTRRGDVRAGAHRRRAHAQSP